MKMTYERPVMRAEVFQAAEYVAACELGDTTQQAGMTGLKLSNAEFWYQVPRANTDWENWNAINTPDSELSKLTFGGAQIRMQGSDGQYNQFYWTTTVGNKTYHLEYSNGSGSWTDTWSDDGGFFSRANPDYEEGDYVFVLYEEDTGNKSLDACVDGYYGNRWDTDDWFPGSEGDNNEGNWAGAPYFDNSLAMFVFRKNAFSVYWS